ncbi:MAG: hypothetical protein KGM24_06255 [Elusimicrobia bacterium]|nr:hypothetical protein [Elusimicrobiota bacterium]
MSKERLRAPLAAAIALLIGGDLAVRGPGVLLDVWGFAFPYLFLFLGFELLRARRALGDEAAFLVGAAAGLLNDGVYMKYLQDGARFGGVAWLASAVSVFDWGMIAVLSLHAAAALLPRDEEEEPAPLLKRWPEFGVLALTAAAVFAIYAYDTAIGRYRYERMIGSTWLFADPMFAAAAVWLVRRAWLSASDSGELVPRPGWLWALGLFCAWLPGAQLFARLAAVSYFYFWGFLLAAWTAGFSWWSRRLWWSRSYADPSPRSASPQLLAAAGWRLVGAIVLLRIFGPFSADGRMALAFSLAVGLPSRLLFVEAFFSSRLAV